MHVVCVWDEHVDARVLRVCVRARSAWWASVRCCVMCALCTRVRACACAVVAWLRAYVHAGLCGRAASIGGLHRAGMVVWLR